MKTALPRRRRTSASREALARKSAFRSVKLQPGQQAFRETPTAPSSSRGIGEPSQAWPKAGDRFYFNSLLVQVWLGQLHRYAADQYAGRTQGKERPMQTGNAWRTFSKLFEPLTAIELVRLFENLLRFANYGAYAPARAFFLAYAPLVFEHDASGEYIGPGVWRREAGSKNAAVRVRRTLERWCDWLEALAHFQIHELCHPAAVHREFDKTIIFLWPLFERHNWSYRELLNLLRSLLHCADAYPCESEHQFANYCRTVLGLRKVGLATVPQDGALAGRAIAERLFKFLPVFH